MATKKPLPEYMRAPDEANLDALESFLAGLDKPQEPTPEPRGALRAVADTALSAGRGAVQGVRMLTDLAGADNAASTGLRKVEDYIGGLKSAEAQADEREMARILREAEGQGVLDQVVAGFKAFAVAPVQTLAQAAGTSIPTLATAMIPGAGPAAVGTRMAAALGMGAAQGVGAVKSSIYDEVLQAHLAAGKTPEEAQALAAQAQAYSSQNAAQIALGAGLGAWAGRSGIESAAERLLHGTTEAVPGVAGRVGIGAVAEGIPEAVQGGQEKFASNTALANEGFAVDPMAGVVASGTMEGLAGAAMGGALGIPRPGSLATDASEKPGDELRAAKLPEAGPMTRAVNAAVEAAAQKADAGEPIPPEPGAPPPNDPRPPVNNPATGETVLPTDPRYADVVRAKGSAAPAGANVDPAATGSVAEGQAGAPPAIDLDRVLANMHAWAAEEAQAQRQWGSAAAPATLPAVAPSPVEAPEPVSAPMGDLLNPDGAPFKNRRAAEKVRAGQADPGAFDVVPVEGGFVVRPTLGFTTDGLIAADGEPGPADAGAAPRDSGVGDEPAVVAGDRARNAGAPAVAAVAGGDADGVRPGEPRARADALTGTAERLKRDAALQPLGNLTPAQRAAEKQAIAKAIDDAVSAGVAEELIFNAINGSRGTVSERIQAAFKPAEPIAAAPAAPAEGTGVTGGEAPPVAAAPDYEARYKAREERAKAAKTAADLDAIVADEHADGERHFEGTNIVERTARARRRALEGEDAAKAKQQEDERILAGGQWVQVTTFTGTGRTEARKEADRLRAADPQHEYEVREVTDYGDVDFTEIRKRRAPKTPTLMDKMTEAAGGPVTFGDLKKRDAQEAAGRWAEASPEQRQQALTAAGWSKGSKANDLMLGKAWDKMTDSQRTRIGAALEAATPPASEGQQGASDEGLQGQDGQGRGRQEGLTTPGEVAVPSGSSAVASPAPSIKTAIEGAKRRLRETRNSISELEANPLMSSRAQRLSELKAKENAIEREIRELRARVFDEDADEDAAPAPKTDKAEIRPYRRPDGSIGYEAVAADQAGPTGGEGSSRGPRGPDAELSPDADEKQALEEKRQMVADMIATKKANREAVPDAWVKRLADLTAQVRGDKADDGATYSMEVPGHPMYDGPVVLRNLVPIKVKTAEDAQRALDRALDLERKVATEFYGAKQALKTAKTPAEKRAAQARVKKLNDQGWDEDALKTLREETIGELSRLVDAAPAPMQASTEGGSTSESDQDRSWREWRENYEQVVASEDLGKFTEGQIRRAINYGAKVASNLGPKAWDGDENAKKMIASYRREVELMEFHLKTRQNPAPASQPNPAQAPAPQAAASQPKAGAPQPSANTIFTEDAAAAARARLKAKLNRVSSNVDPEMLMDGITLAGYHIEKGARRFAAYARAMVDDLGEGVKPYLQSWYMAIRSDPRAAAFKADMDKASEVEDIDVDAVLADSGRAAAPAPEQNATQETNDGQATQPPLDAGDSGASGAPGSGRGARAQQRDARVDSGSVEGAQPGDVGAADGQQPGRPAGEGAAGADVGPASGTAEGGPAGDGRAGAGGTRAPDARAGGRVRKGASKRGQPEPVAAPDDLFSSPASTGPGDFVIADPMRIVGGGQVARFDKNKAAIELRNRLIDESRKPTTEEQEVLAGYTGWGSFGQELFQGTWQSPAPKKGWEQRDRWLRDNLGQKEWEGMRDSIINAHYTDPPTVLAMWDMVRRLGFTGGRVLEPSIGIGNFYGMMPADLTARSQRAGIELDPVTGSMAQMLYPQANIQIKGYEESKTPDNFYDLVIGNWPFFEHGPADRRYNRLNPTLHDYFFLKAIDQTRPGGLIVGITTKGTMDKKGVNARMEMARKAELVAAFRLPTGAFEEYAGTKVVTDIIILRKRERPTDMVAGEGWINVLDHKTAEGTEVPVNEYFHKNPGHVIGSIDFGHGTTTFRPGLIVHRPDDMMGELRRIVSLVPEGVFKASNATKHISYVANHTSDRTNALTKTKDGLFIVQGEYLAPANQVAKYELKSEAKTAERVRELEALIDMRRLYGVLIDAERGGKPEAARKALRDAYEAFVKQSGSLSESFGLGYLRKIDDPFYPAIAALEVASTDGKGKTTYRPAAILSASTMRGAKTMANPGITDAFVLARNESVSPGLARIAELSGKPEAEVKAALIEAGAAFELPNGDFAPSDVYLSGNVREKLREAQAGLADGNKAMQRNVDALTEVLPPTIPYFKIETQMGATWVPPKDYEAWISHMLGMDDTEGIKVKFEASAWKVSLDGALNHRAQASSGFGSANVRFRRLVQAAIANQTITVKRKDSDGNEYVDDEATKEVNAKIADIRSRFGEWLWSDPERRTRLEAEYNEVRNAYATPRFDGSFLSFSGMALSLGRGPFNLRQHQVNAIWRALVTRKSLNAHEVGTGKTFTMGGIAVESRRYGIAKKPLLLAHNANSKSVAHEIQQMYPGAKVLYVDNLSKENVKVRMMQMANDDWDVIVMPHSLIGRIGFKEETLMGMAREEIADLELAAEEAADEDGVKISASMWDDEKELAKLRSPTAKQLVKSRMKIISTIKKLAQQASREDSIAFEDMGVDMVMVDEAHEFKKPPIATKMRMKGLQTATSDRSIALMFMTKYIRALSGGGNVHLFTGTPITNTMTEVFHMMRYMMQEEMSAAALADWDGWFGSFAREVSDVELNPAGEYEAVTRLQSFINVPELRRMIGQYMDVVFAEDMPEMQLRLVGGKRLTDPDLTEAQRREILEGRTEDAADRPYKKVINQNSDMTPEQLRVFEKVQGWARAWRNMTKKQRKDAMTLGAPESPIIHEGIAARASFDVRLVDAIRNAGREGTKEMEPHPDSKPARVLRNLLDIYRGDSRATQVVFMEQGMAKSVTRREGPPGQKVDVSYPAFSTVADMIERLVQAGVPRDQIALVDGSTSKDKRKAIADAMNTGDIRIVFGSSDSLGVGVNMQRNLRAMHHMDAPWMPGELEQRNGRGHRQGNQWNTVLEYRYLTDRLDGRRWQVLAIKQKFITDFMKSKGDVRVIEGDAASDDGGDILSTFSEAAGDPRLLLREKFKKKVEHLQGRERIHGQAVSDAQRTIRDSEAYIRDNERALDKLRKAGAKQALADLVERQRGDGFTATIEGRTHTDRAEALEDLKSWLTANVRKKDGLKEVGTYGGQKLWAHWPYVWNDEPTLFMEFPGEVKVEASPSWQSLDMRLRGLRDSVESNIEERITDDRERLKHARKVAVEPFHLQGELDAAKTRLDDLIADIERNPVAPPYWLRAGAPADTDITYNGKTFTVTGHRWSDAGWFVLATDERGEVSIPYMEARDTQGMPLYEEREFERPTVQQGSTGTGVPVTTVEPPKATVIAETPGANIAQTGAPEANETDVVFSRAPNTKHEIRAAKAALTRIEAAGGVTSASDLQALTRVSGFSQWTESPLVRDLDAAARLQGELQERFGDGVRGDWRRPFLNQQGVVGIQSDWVAGRATQQDLTDLVEMTARYGAPVIVRGHFSNASTQVNVPRLLQAGFERYRGTQEFEGRPAGSAISFIIPRGNISAVTPLFARGRSAGGLDIASARSLAEDLVRNGVVRLNVVQSVADLPPRQRKQVLARDPDGRARGAYFRGSDQVWIVADNIRGADEFVEVALHEAFHRGLAKTISEAGPVLQEMWRTNQSLRVATKAQMDRHGIDKAEAIEEALADMAGQGKARDLKGWGKLLELVRGFLAKVARAVGVEINWTDDMVADFVAGITREGLSGGMHLDIGTAAAPMLKRGDAPFDRWFGDSKIVNADGTPKVMYHGTTASFDRFKPDSNGLIFVTPDPQFAGNFTRSVRTGAEGANLMPVYVSAGKPFDPANAAHRSDLIGHLFDKHPTYRMGDGQQALLVDGVRTLYTEEVLAEGLRGEESNWLLLEQPWLLDAVERLGYDSIYVMEEGVKNLAVFDATQLKSATGNRGTFDPADDDIRMSRSAAARQVVDRAHDLLTTQRSFNWWHRTVGTQFHKAQTNPAFKRVYDLAQDYLHDTSAFANDAADLAPDLLPQLKTLGDVKKSLGLSKVERERLGKAVFEGTLAYTRDDSGQVVEADGTDTAGVVWTPAELKERYGFTDDQVKLYQQFRASTNRSLDTLAAADVARLLGDMLPPAMRTMISEGDLGRFRGIVTAFVGQQRAAAEKELADMRRRHRNEMSRHWAKQKRTLEGPQGRAGSRLAALNDLEAEKNALKLRQGGEKYRAEQALAKWADLDTTIRDKFTRIDDLKGKGYAPLMRFGRYTVDVVNEAGEREFFSLYESQAEANAAARRLAGEFEGATVSQGILSEEAYKQFSGMTPETLELFAELAGVEKTALFEEYLRRAKNNRSAMKRLIKRQGIAGYSEDPSRVLASFVTSNARAASSNLHVGLLSQAVEDIPKEMGDVKDEAIKLREYVQNPQEEAQALRGLLFVQYLGGSVASAMVNLTQPLMMTFPYLSQFGGPAKAAKRLAGAIKAALGSYDKGSELGRALRQAEKDGVVSPQELHQLQAEASGPLAGGRLLRRFTFLWGSLFSAAEQFNRRVSFVAAYQTALEQGMDNPFRFAEATVDQTQGVYNKGNRPNWARGAVGSTVFTFKQYSISYVEFLKRLPTRERTLALAILVLAAGAQGIPGADDLDDLIDTLGQHLGYDTNAKLWKQTVLEDAIGKEAAHFALYGFSALPGVPLDVAGRLGLGNVIPGTGFLRKDKADKSGEVAEAIGPVGSTITNTVKAVPALLSGDFGQAHGLMGATATKNLAKAVEMYQTGEYRDTKGRKVMDVTPGEALLKGIGFQPQEVAKASRQAQMVQQRVALARAVESEIADSIARARVDAKPEEERKARQRLADWNADNPETRINITAQQIIRRVREMRLTREDRLVKAAPRELRRTVAEGLQ